MGELTEYLKNRLASEISEDEKKDIRFWLENDASKIVILDPFDEGYSR